MADPYMPSVVVEIAFNAGYATPAASRTWTDVSDYVELSEDIKIDMGRTNEFGKAEPGKLDLVLDNSDGRFTAARAASPYYPNVKIGRPIRVTSTRVGGAASIRYVGYVDVWPTEWKKGVGTYASTAITASTRRARMGLDSELLNIADETYADAVSVYGYWPLTDAVGSPTANDVSGLNAPLTDAGTGAALVLGTEILIGGGESTGALFAAGRYKAGTVAVPSTASDLIIEGVFQSNAGANGTSAYIFELTGPGGYAVRAGFDSGFAALRTVDPGGAGLTTSGINIMDGLPHHLACHVHVVAGTTQARLYVDGAYWSGHSFLTAGAITFTTIKAGHTLNGTVSHVLVSGDLAGVPDRGESILGFAGEIAGDRVVRLAGFAGVPAAEVFVGAGTQPVAAFDTAGKTAVDAMQVVEDTEGGVIWDARNGTIQFAARASRYNRTNAFTLDAALQQVEATISPQLDRTALVNVATSTSGDTSATATNQASLDDYGNARVTTELAAGYDTLLAAAQWQVNTYGEPKPRIPSVMVDILPFSGAMQDALFSADIGTRMGIVNMPSQAPTSSADYFAEGYTETIGVQRYTLDFNVSPTDGYDVVKLDDPVLGVYTVYRLAY